MRKALLVYCLIDIVTSNRAKGRLLKALQVLNSGKRTNTYTLQYKNKPAFIKLRVARKYSKFLYIYNTRPSFKVDLIKDLLSKVYLS